MTELKIDPQNPEENLAPETKRRLLKEIKILEGLRSWKPEEIAQNLERVTKRE